MSYEPKPIDTSGVTLSKDLRNLTELLAKNNHTSGLRSVSPKAGTQTTSRTKNTPRRPGALGAMERCERRY